MRRKRDLRSRIVGAGWVVVFDAIFGSRAKFVTVVCGSDCGCNIMENEREAGETRLEDATDAHVML